MIPDVEIGIQQVLSPVRKTQKLNRKVANQFDLLIRNWPKLIRKCFLPLYSIVDVGVAAKAKPN